jgi:hypothetical protein
MVASAPPKIGARGGAFATILARQPAHAAVRPAPAQAAPPAPRASLATKAPLTPSDSARRGALHARFEIDHDDRKKPRGAFDPLDPHARHAAQCAPPIALAEPAPIAPAHAAEAAARASMEAILPELVQRIAWSREGARTGAVRMEIGKGSLAGGTLFVRTDDGKIRVHLTTPAGADKAGWRARIENALRERGLDVDSIEVA